MADQTSIELFGPVLIARIDNPPMGKSNAGSPGSQGRASDEDRTGTVDGIN